MVEKLSISASALKTAPARDRSATSLRQLFGMIRLPNCIMIAIAVLAGYIVVARTLSPSVYLLFAALTAALLTGFANVTNDLADLQVDTINQPGRPLPSGKVSTSAAKAFAIVLLIMGFISVVFTGATLNLVLASLAALAAVAYNFRLKGTGLPGNMVVSLLVALPFLYGSTLLPSSEWFDDTLLVLILTAFLANLGREIQKGIVDVKGDASRGIQTAAVKFGVPIASRLAAVLYISAVILSFLPLGLGSVSLSYAVLIFIVDLGFLRSSIILLRGQAQGKTTREKNLILLWMGLTELAFIVGRFLR